MPKTMKLYMMTVNDEDRFAFHAANDGDAGRKASRWAQYQGFTRTRGVNVDAHEIEETNPENIHDDYVS